MRSAIALIHELRLQAGSTGLRVEMTGVITDLRVAMTGVIAAEFLGVPMRVPGASV